MLEVQRQRNERKSMREKLKSASAAKEVNSAMDVEYEALNPKPQTVDCRP